MSIAPELEAVIDAAKLAQSEYKPARQQRPHPQYLRAWAVPALYRTHVENSYSTPAVDAVMSWSSDKAKPMLVLAGPKGIGKSVAAACWLHSELPNEPSGKLRERWVKAMEIQMLGQYDRAAHKLLIHEELLVIDEVGNELRAAENWWLGRFEYLLSRRIEELKPTILTTNISGKRKSNAPSDFEAAYGSRTLGRLRESAKWIELDGESHRPGET